MSGETASSTNADKDSHKEKPPDKSRRKRWEVDELEDPGKRSRMSAYELQKKRLERLMAQPDKPVDVPDQGSEWKPKDPPDFVRFYMGSSAGAGSEVFHVYRHLRRYEMTRQDWINSKAEEEDKNAEYVQKLAQLKAEAEEKTARKRAKRLKKKERAKSKKEQKPKQPAGSDDNGKQEADSAESGGDSDDAYENPFVIGGR